MSSTDPALNQPFGHSKAQEIWPRPDVFFPSRRRHTRCSRDWSSDVCSSDLTEGGMLKHKHSDIGVAVAMPGGLITPIIRKAETKSLSTISGEMKDFAARARARKLKQIGRASCRERV